MIEVDPIHQHIADLAMKLMVVYFVRDAMLQNWRLMSASDLRDELIEAGILSEENAYWVRKREELIALLLERRYPTVSYEKSLADFGVDIDQIRFG